MALRTLSLPKDLQGLGEMLPQTFRYPDNPEWSIQSDEQEELAGYVKAFRRMWPLFRALMLVVPSFRDGMRGFVWEEKETLAAATLYHRLGSTSCWDISTVGVLPDFRRRGLARQLIERTLQDIHGRGGKRITLGVISENLPARSLYKSVGFEDFGGFVKYESSPSAPPRIPALPEGYDAVRLKQFDWKTRYELARRITPTSTAKYDPVTPGKFKEPLPIRPLIKFLLMIRGTVERSFAIRCRATGQVVGIGHYSVPKRGKGMSRLGVRLDPEHGELADYIVKRLLSTCVTLNPGRRIEISIRHWMGDVISAAEAANMERRVDNRRMGLLLD